MPPFASFSGATSPGFSGVDQFPDPFNDVASLSMPTGIRSALRMCERVMEASGAYRMGMERLLSYFLTDVEIVETDDDEREHTHDFLVNTLGVIQGLQNLYRDRMTYGNGFMSVYMPFKRLLNCPKCGRQFPLATVYNNSEFNFRWQRMQFVAKCLCGFDGEWKVNDQPDDLQHRLKLKLWNVHEIELLHDPFSHDTHYIWRIPEDYKRQIKIGYLYFLERVPMAVLEAIRNNLQFRFFDDMIFHMKEPTLGGIRNRGWGIPRTLTNWRQIYYVQTLRRYNEALALDYVIPFRLITPVSRSGATQGGTAKGNDPLLSVNMGDFMGSVRAMLKRRRRDPAGWHTLPYPVEYQALGGDATALMPKDILQEGVQQLLNDAGCPMELFNGTLALQALQPGLRVFEATNIHMVRDGNNFLKWLMRQLSRILGWSDIPVRLKSVRIADDLQRQMLIMQLLAGQQISGETAFKALELDWRQESKQIGQEQVYTAEQQSKLKEEMDALGLVDQMSQGPAAQQQGGQPAQGGAGAAPAGSTEAAVSGGGGSDPVGEFLAANGQNSSMSMDDLMEAATDLSQKLASQPQSARTSALRRLKAAHPTLHDLVTARLKDIRSQARSVGQQQVMSQQFGQG